MREKVASEWKEKKPCLIVTFSTLTFFVEHVYWKFVENTEYYLFREMFYGKTAKEKLLFKIYIYILTS